MVLGRLSEALGFVLQPLCADGCSPLFLQQQEQGRGGGAEPWAVPVGTVKNSGSQTSSLHEYVCREMSWDPGICTAAKHYLGAFPPSPVWTSPAERP